MFFLIIGIFILIIMMALKIVFEFNIKKMKSMGENKELDEIANKYPDNLEMCKEYLEMLNNKDVIIEENKENDASLYIAISNKILIANLRKSYTRIQTIAHECLHSVQDRRLLMFNFFISNIFLIYFIVSLILASFFQHLQKELLFILLLIGMTMYMVRAFLENDAMIKARYLAKDYLEKKEISDRAEIKKLLDGFDMINKIGIKAINYDLFCKVLNKSLLFCVICIIYNFIK